MSGEQEAALAVGDKDWPTPKPGLAIDPNSSAVLKTAGPHGMNAASAPSRGNSASSLELEAKAAELDAAGHFAYDPPTMPRLAAGRALSAVGMAMDRALTLVQRAWQLDPQTRPEPQLTLPDVLNVAVQGRA